MPEFEYIIYHPSTDDPKTAKAIAERKPLTAESLTEARRKVSEMPGALIGGKPYNPKLIEPKR